MERIRKALEQAKAERDAALRGIALPTAQVLERVMTAPAGVVAEPQPALSPVRETIQTFTHAAAPAPSAAPVVDTVVTIGPEIPPEHHELTGRFLRTRELPVDPEHLRKARLLAPDMKGPMAQAFKMLRTQVMQRMRARNWNTLAVLSATPDEGKTTVAINLGMAISMDLGHSALVVDFDLRNPSLATRLGIPAQPGVEQCLVTGRPVSEVFVRLAGYDRLMLLPAGGPIVHSSELLGGEATHRLVAELKSRYADRIVLFDLPPLLGSDDALAFVPQVDAVLLVIAEGHTRTEELNRAVELIKDRPVVGTVLNRSRSGDAGYYGYY